MPREDHIDTRLVQNRLQGHPHALSLTFMCSIRVIPRRVDQRENPRRLGPINSRQVSLQPPVLIRAVVKIRVGPEHDNVGPGHVEGVVQVGDGPTLLVGHSPSGAVGHEGLWIIEDRELLDLVVALRHHPRPRARIGLDEAAERVP